MALRTLINGVTKLSCQTAIAVLMIFLLSTSKVSAQLVVQPNPTLNQLTDAIVGPGFFVQAATLNCPNGAFGMFDGLNTNLGIDEGVLLTSGSVLEAVGPNNSGSTGVNNGAPGDNQLDVLSAATTFDGCVLEMDLIPSCDTLRISYVFGSEEYPEFVGQEFNDVFAFFVSGPGIAGSQNVALIPNTTTPVSVNEVNNNSNTGYYVDNNGGNTIQYDGFTTVLEGKIPVQLCEVYHLKLAVADVVDGIYESGVFIKGNSVKCNDIVYTDQVRNYSGTEGCSNGSFTFCREGDMSVPYVINLDIGGTAINGVDYQALPNSVTIPAGDTCITIEVIPIHDDVPELDETIEIVYQQGPCPIGDTIVLTLSDPMELNAGPDKEVCSGEPVKIGKDSIEGATYTWIPATGLSDANILTPVLTLTNVTGAPITYEYVQVANNGICDIMDTLYVTVFPNPVVSFNKSNSCINESISFEDETTPDIGVQWQWDFGDNFLDLNQNPNHVYTGAGDYDVSLTITDTAGCDGTLTESLTVWGLPVSDYSFVEACQGDSVEFTNASTSDVASGGNIDSVFWDFGDLSNISHENSPKYKFTLAAIYNVSLSVKSDSGCVSTFTDFVNVRAKPVADFFGDTVCLHDEMEFEDNSTISNGIISDYFWDFGDGSAVVTGESDPIHLYGNDSSYSVELIVVSGYGCTDTIEKSVTVRPLPVSGFYGEDVCVGLKTQFTDTSSSGGNGLISSWKWNFDNSFISQDQNPLVTLSDTGVHNISLIVITDKGCTDTVSGQTLVLPKPIVDFGPVNVCETVETEFENLAYSIYTWDTISQHEWDFGDLTPVETVKNPNHTYATLGQYDVTLTVTTDSGCVESKTKPVYVHGKPEVQFDAPPVCIHNESQFTNTSSVGDGYIEKLYWDFGGQGIDSMVHYPSFEFDSVKTFPVCLMAISNYGCSDSLIKNVVVNGKPQADFVKLPDHCFGKKIDFIGSASSSLNGTISKYEWNHGDGFISNGAVSSYTYPLEGEFIVSLIIEDDNTCRDTLMDTVSVLGLPEMEVITDNLCAGDSCYFELEFEQGAAFNIASISWSFGDGGTIQNDTTPSYYYNTTGEYEVSVEAISDSGCVIENTETVQIYDAPYGGFVVDTVCLEEPSKFISQALPPAGSFINKWTYVFPDGVVGSTSNYNHVFDSAGVFEVTQIVETNNGCRDTVVQIAKVYPIPVLNFSVGSVEGCAPFCATFESEITVENAKITYTEWDFGDGNISTDTNPTFCFEEEGDFTMSLTVENSFGCSVTKSKDSFIKVYPSPSAGFVTDWVNLSENNPEVNIFNTAIFTDRIEWFFGDGTYETSTGDVSHVYDSIGSYDMYQVVTNEFGCTDTAWRRINVNLESGVYIPNAFTPEVSQGVNDYFYPVVYGPLREAEYNMYIYNRWGQMVFHANDLNEVWDGSFNGVQVQEDVYVYKITFLIPGSEEDDYIMYKGHVNLIK